MCTQGSDVVKEYKDVTKNLNVYFSVDFNLSEKSENYPLFLELSWNIQFACCVYPENQKSILSEIDTWTFMTFFLTCTN